MHAAVSPCTCTSDRLCRCLKAALLVVAAAAAGRALGAYMSQRDLQQMVVKSIEADDITDSYGVPFQIFYGAVGLRRASPAACRPPLPPTPPRSGEVQCRTAPASVSSC